MFVVDFLHVHCLAFSGRFGAGRLEEADSVARLALQGFASNGGTNAEIKASVEVVRSVSRTGIVVGVHACLCSRMHSPLLLAYMRA